MAGCAKSLACKSAGRLNCNVQVIEPLMQPLVTPATVPIHPVAALHEKCQHAGLQLQYRTSATDRAGQFCTEAVVRSRVVGRYELSL